MTPMESRRVPCLFTLSLSLFFVGILFFIALLKGQRDLIILSLLVFAMTGGLKLWARFSPAGMRCTLTLDKNRAFAGDTLLFKSHAENAKFLPVRLELEVPVHASSRMFPCETPLVGHESLLWYQMTNFQWEVTAAARGVCEIGPIRMATGDLFGFFQKNSKTGEIIECLIYPRLVPLGPLSLPRRDFFGVPGGESPVDDPVYILGTADYQNGRPAKYIHWKASARHHRLQEKVFESTDQEKVLLVVEVDPFVKAGAENEFERTLEVVASLAVRLDRQGCAVGLLTNGITKGISPAVSVSRSPQQLSKILEALARIKMETAEGLIHVLRKVEIPWGTSSLYFTLEEDPATDVVKAHFKRRKMPVLVYAFEGAAALRRDIPVDIHDTISMQDAPVAEVLG
ncbi:MAG: DUF58 domain-containing protein [Deltaproteobacteria bacterium]|nr:DUF58 domain-containing protein [Deltaproteobacteria bacterium]